MTEEKVSFNREYWFWELIQAILAKIEKDGYIEGKLLRELCESFGFSINEVLQQIKLKYIEDTDKYILPLTRLPVGNK